MQGFRHITAIGFDLDGTLYPAASLYLRSMNLFARNPRFISAFSAVRREIRALQEQPSWAAKNSEALHEIQAFLVSNKLGISPDAARAAMERIIYRELPSRFRRLRPYPGVREAIQSILTEGFRIALLSDLPPKEKLESLGLADLFPIALCAEDAGVLKPHLRAFAALTSALETPPDQTLYIGNSHRYDVEGAHRAGFAAAIRGPAAGKADYVFTSWPHLAQWIIGLRRGSGNN